MRKLAPKLQLGYELIYRIIIPKYGMGTIVWRWFPLAITTEWHNVRLEGQRATEAGVLDAWQIFEAIGTDIDISRTRCFAELASGRIQYVLYVF